MLPTSRHAFTVTPNELHAPFTSVCWTPEDYSELLIIDIIDDIIWVREYLRFPVTRQPRVGMARRVSHFSIEGEFILGARIGSVVEAYLTDRSHGRLPRLVWFPIKPDDWLVHRMSYTVQWLSGALDM